MEGQEEEELMTIKRGTRNLFFVAIFRILPADTSSSPQEHS